MASLLRVGAFGFDGSLEHERHEKSCSFLVTPAETLMVQSGTRITRGDANGLAFARFLVNRVAHIGFPSFHFTAFALAAA